MPSVASRKKRVERRIVSAPASREFNLEISGQEAFSADELKSLFGPPLYTPEQQLQAPNQPRTRLIKDVLAVGRWKVGDDFWDVKPETLNRIARTYHDATKAGNSFNLCYGHGHPVTGSVDARDLVRPLDQVRVFGNRLFTSTYVTQSEADKLRNPANRVSVRVLEKWTDGTGRDWPMALLHVALVDQPVMNKQGPFLDLCNDNRRRDMAEDTAEEAVVDEVADDTGDETAGGMGDTFDFPTVLDLMTRTFNLLGVDVPDGITEENLPIVWETLLSTLPANDDDEDDMDDGMDEMGDGAETMEGLDPEAGALPAADLANVDASVRPILQMMLADNRALKGAVKDLSNAFLQQRAEGARSSYIKKLDTLAKAGKINAKAVVSLTHNGAAHGYDLSLLTPFDDLPGMVDMQRRGRSLATSQAAAVETSSSDLTADQIAALAKTVAGRK